MILSDRSGIFFRKARQRTVNWTGSKMKCVELCNFLCCCAFIFCQPMKKFEFFYASRATRQRHFKTSSTGKENGAVGHQHGGRKIGLTSGTYFGYLGH